MTSVSRPWSNIGVHAQKGLYDLIIPCACACVCELSVFVYPAVPVPALRLVLGVT